MISKSKQPLNRCCSRFFIIRGDMVSVLLVSVQKFKARISFLLGIIDLKSNSDGLQDLLKRLLLRKFCCQLSAEQLRSQCIRLYPDIVPPLKKRNDRSEWLSVENQSPLNPSEVDRDIVHICNLYGTLTGEYTHPVNGD